MADEETQDVAVAEQEPGTVNVPVADDDVPAEMVEGAQKYLDAREKEKGEPFGDGDIDVVAEKEEAEEAKAEADAKAKADASAQKKADAEAQIQGKLDWRREQAARRMGWDADYLKELGDARDSILDKAADGLDAISTKMSEFGRKAAPDKSKEGDEGEGDDTEEAVVFDPEAEFAFKDAEDHFDDETRNLVLAPLAQEYNALKSHVAELRSQLERVMPYVADVQQNQDRAEDKEIEKFFGGIEAHFGDAYGKGATTEHKEDSAEHVARQGLVDLAWQLQDGYANRGEKISMNDALEMALSISQKDRIAQIAVEKRVERTKKRGKQITPQATGKRTSQQTLEDKALAALETRVRELQIAP